MAQLWCKLWVGLLDDPKWDVVAAEAASSKAAVISCWVGAMEEATKRGGPIGRLKIEVLAAGLRLAIDEVRRIWDAFRKLGLIAGDRLAAWAERQSPFLCRCLKAAAAPGLDQSEAPAAADLSPAPLSETRREETPPVVPPAGGEPRPEVSNANLPEEGATTGLPAATVVPAPPGELAPGGEQGGRAAHQLSMLYPIPGGTDAAGPRSRRRKLTPHQAQAESFRRLGAALRDARAVSGGWGAAACA